MGLTRTITTALAIVIFAMAIGCQTVYLNQTMGFANYADVYRPPEPLPVKIDCEFRHYLGIRMGFAEKGMREEILDVFEATGVFSEAPDEYPSDTPTLHVKFKDTTSGKARARAFASSYLTTYSLGLIGTHMPVSIDMVISLSNNTDTIFQETYPLNADVYQGRHTTPTDSIKVETPDDYNEAFEDALLTFIRDYQKNQQ